MEEAGEFVRVRWSPRGDRSWCPGATLPRPVGAEGGKVVTGWTTFFRLQGVLGRRRARPGAAVDAAPSLLPGESTARPEGAAAAAGPDATAPDA